MRILLLLLSICLTSQTFAQLYKQPWVLGISVGISGYKGDIQTPFGAIDSTTLPALGIYATHNFNPRIAVSLFGTISGLRAADSLSRNAYWKTRNLAFHTWLFDAGLRFEFNFLPYLVDQRKVAWAPYLSLGPVLTYINPKTKIDGEVYELHQAQTNQEKPEKGFSRIFISPSLGGGFKYNYVDNYSLGIHFEYRYASTDYIDDVSGNYRDPSSFNDKEDAEIQVILHDPSVKRTTGGVAVLGKQRDSNSSNDAYWTLSITGSYTFKRSNCPYPIQQRRY